MNEIINSFGKGLNTDSPPELQPKDTYIFAKNAVPNTDSGDSYILTNEKGFLKLDTILPPNLYEIGKYMLEDDLVLCLCDKDSTISEIGIVDKYNLYTSFIRTDSTGTTYRLPDGSYTSYTSPINELKFDIKYQMDMTGRKAFDDNRIIYITDNLNIPRAINLDKIITPIDKTTSLQLNQKIPIIDLDKVNDTGGIINVGSYQFIARHVTANGNTTSFGILSEIIPIVDEPSTTTRQLFDGKDADFPTAKSISLIIRNLDTSFKYIEIAVLYYTGPEQTLQIKIFDKKEIIGNTVATTYTGTEETTDVLLNDLQESTIFYSRAKCIEQKNATLLLSNLGTTPLASLQTAFNNIIVKYTIEEHLFPETITGISSGTALVSNTSESLDGNNDIGDYKNPRLTFEKKGYMRDEVYSLAGMVAFKNGSFSPAFHIPGNDKVTTTTTPANVGTGVLGTYVSTELYPTGQNYPVTTGNTVRHHKIPTLLQEPHYRLSSGSNFIRILGLEFTNIDFSSFTSIIDNIAGIVFLVEPRDNANKKSIKAQGIGQSFIQFTGNNGEDGKKGPDFAYSVISPGFENFRLETDDFGDSGHQIQLRHHFNGGESWNILPRKVGFYSPDILLGNTKILTSDLYSPALEIKGNENNVIVTIKVNGSDYDTPSNLDDFYHNFCDFNDIVGTSVPTPVQIKDSLLTHAADNITSFGVDNPYKLYNQGNEGYQALELGVDMPLPSYYDRQFHHLYKHSDPGDRWLSGDPFNISPDVIHRWLTNITTTLTRQYGDISDAKYKVIGNTLLDTNTLPSSKICFNGDTFISKFAYKNSLKIAYEFKLSDWHEFDAVHEGDGGLIGDNAGFETRCIGYFFVESTINTNYRYRFKNITTGQFGVDYFPHNLIVSEYGDTIARVQGNGILDQSWRVDDSNYYNTLYSKESTQKEYIPIPQGFEEVTNFDDRTIHSQKSFEGDTVDSYRIFKANDYHDIPKNTGPIWDTFVFNNKFYIHTTHSLWRTFFEEITSQATTSTNEVFLGAGTAFSLPSQQIFTSEGGYAGTQSQWAGSLTPFGYVFPDSLQAKWFILIDELQEISMNGKWRFFNKNMGLIDFIGSPPNYTDNPANPDALGFISGYDYMNKIIYLTKKDLGDIITTELNSDLTGNNQYTISYSPIFKNFISFHDYIPSAYISREKELLSILNTPSINRFLYKHHEGNYGVYYTNDINTYDIVFSVNDNPLSAKVFDNGIIYTTSLEESSNNPKPREIFNSIQIYNREMNSTTIPLVLNSNIYLKENKFRITIPRSAVIDSSLNIFDSGNLNVSLQFKERIRGNHIIVKLIYNNTNNYKFNFHAFLTKIRQSII